MFTELMTSRRFAPLFWCQFCSALNDNLLKNALVMLILFGLGGSGGAGGPYGPALVTLAGVVLIAPFFILSGLGGELADRYDKARVASYIKLVEIPMAAVAAAGFYLQSVPILFAALGLFGAVAALFGPVKYGILPEKLEMAELPAGNALVEGATFVAILAGTIAGAIAVTASSTPEIVSGLIMAFAIASWLFARGIPAAGPAAPGLPITAQRVDIDRDAAARARGRCATMGRRTYHIVVLADGLGGAGATPDHGQGQPRRHRGRGDARPCNIRGRHRRGVRSRREGAATARPTLRWCRWAVC